MNQTRKAMLTLAIVVSLLVHPFPIQATQDPSSPEVSDLLNQGVQAYKQGQFDLAIDLFERCVALEPTSARARLYLASAYASQYIPGAPSEENQQAGENALEQFREALKINPMNLSAIDGIASMLFQMGGVPYDPRKFQESLEYHKRHIGLQPQDAEPHYWIGVIDWTLAYRTNMELRAKYNEGTPEPTLKGDQPLPEYLRRDFQDGYKEVIAEGIQHLKQAIQLKEDYDDAMAYLSLIYRQKADMAATLVERQEWLARADDLVEQVKAIKAKRTKF